MDQVERRVRATLNSIPGYKGYRSLEDRRDDDRRIRESIATDISVCAERLTRVGAQLAAQRKMQQVSAIERLVGETRHLSDRVRTASYGYGGLFGSQSVGASALDQLRLFDETFLYEAASLLKLAGDLSIGDDGVSTESIDTFSGEIIKLNSLFDARSKVVESAQPSQDAGVLALLDPPAPIVISQIATLSRGDALSVNGNNYVVDAIVRIGSGDDIIGLARVGKDSDENPLWLIGGNTALVSTRLASQTTGEAPVGGLARRAEALIQTADESVSNVMVQYGSSKDTDFWYTIGNETRIFTGTTVADEDIEVFGQS